ncbi:MAG: aldo/keto reductase [Granulosicoccus sp.]|nr:aldo/keto reductase [Granulosicoccus sp.]
MNFLDSAISPLGLGCWPIGGEMYAADGTSLGYSNADDQESLRAIHAALANGISLFDTAAAYGAGHSERLLAKALGGRPDARIVTKIGIEIDENSKRLLGAEVEAVKILPAIEQSLRRLGRDCIDLLLLHQNGLSLEQAEPVFDEMEKALQSGKISGFGWSTDFTASAAAMAERSGFVAVEHAMHVLMDAPKMQATVEQHQLLALIRSPLAMGLLSGKYSTSSTLPETDVRATNPGWAKYYVNGKPNPEYMKRFDAVSTLLQIDGRSTVQGALAWLWAKSPLNIPLPGARTVKQVEELAAARAYGALPASTMDEIAELVGGVGESDGCSER